MDELEIQEYIYQKNKREAEKMFPKRKKSQSPTKTLNSSPVKTTSHLDSENKPSFIEGKL